MSLKYFLCPDGVTRPITECLESCPNKQGRCLSLPTLYDVGHDRIWANKPSTTQLLNPPRQEYLKITKDYAIKPKSRAFALLGTRHHRRLEVVAKKIEGIEAELKLKSPEVSGILDLLEPDPNQEGYYILWDYKTWGSYSLALHLGLKINGEYEQRQLALQTNNYRILVEAIEELNFKISQIKVQCTVRDGHTKSAYWNKIEDTIVVLPIDFLPDDEVKEYFSRKREALLTALETETMPGLCDYEERWKGRRCKGDLCPVHPFCPEGAKINKVELKT